MVQLGIIRLIALYFNEGLKLKKMNIRQCEIYIGYVYKRIHINRCIYISY